MPNQSVSYNTLRNNIVALLETVSEVGQVHNRLRFANNWQTLLNMFKTDPPDGVGESLLLGWMLTRTDKTPLPEDGSFGRVYYLHHFQLQGIMAHSDEGDSEGAFQDLIDRILLVLDADSALLGGSNVQEGSGPATARLIELRTFGTVLAHYAEIDFTVPTEETRA